MDDKSNDLLEILDIGIPPVEVDMVVDDEPIVFNDDPSPSLTATYKNEMLKSGLTDSDVEYFFRAYKNLEDVKFIKIHCTACDKHIGSAPNELSNRYQHPLLKVLLCADCFQFYSSGDFEKDKDGSELYCRWCGEGGQVFCCTTCPYVFCKNCIKRNLGRGVARIIQTTDNWICFSCNPWQINRHRATYWAIQKYSEEMIERSKLTGEEACLDVDANICCSAVKRRTDVYSKLKSSMPKRPKLSVAGSTPATVAANAASSSRMQKPVLIGNLASTSNYTPKNNINNNMIHWQEPVEQDEVICTPDIIPIDDSPPNSPVPAPPQLQPAPKINPFVTTNNIQLSDLQSAPTVNPFVTTNNIQLSDLQSAPTMSPYVATNSIQLSDLQKHLQSAFPQKFIFTTSPNSSSPVLLQNHTNLDTNSYRFIFNSTKPSGISSPMHSTNFVFAPIRPTVATTVTKPVSNPVPVQKKVPVPIKVPVQVVNSSSESNECKDWFDKAIMECAEVTEYISTKISSLSGVHSRAYKSQKLMDELHNTLQTYVTVAIEKLHKMKRNMQNNYDNGLKTDRLVNPFAAAAATPTAAATTTKSEESSTSMSSSEDDNSNPKQSVKKRKNPIMLSKHVKPEEVLFDMDVTNASDEEMPSSQSSRSNSVAPHSDNEQDEDDEQDAVSPPPVTLKVVDETPKEDEKTTDDNESKKNNSEVIDILDSSDEATEKEENSCKKLPVFDLLQDVESKFNIKNISSDDLLKYLSAIVVIKNSKENQLRFDQIAESINAHKSNVFDLCLSIQMLLNNDLPAATLEDKKQKPNPEEFYDVEEMLSSNVLVRPSKEISPKSKSFGDAFNKFIDNVDESQLARTDDVVDDLKDIADELDIIPELVNSLQDKDNGSLSLPPSSIAEFANNGDIPGESARKNGDGSDASKGSELILDSGILALKQMAENCVGSSVELRKVSAECKG